jgi:hypothetical protein
VRDSEHLRLCAPHLQQSNVTISTTSSSQNDSLQDIGQRQDLYRALISLLKLLGSSMDTVEVGVGYFQLLSVMAVTVSCCGRGWAPPEALWTRWRWVGARGIAQTNCYLDTVAAWTQSRIRALSVPTEKVLPIVARSLSRLQGTSYLC